MASNNYWMKLWFDILRDPKMGMLPDRLWRRVIELFLLAGQQGEEGLLPNTSEIAWQLNKPEKAIITDLENIRKTGIVDINVDGVWYVTNFKKRNAPVSSSERAKDFRMRNYGNPETNKKTMGIYKITCLENGKTYIGSSVDCDRRISVHFSEANQENNWMNEDMSRYGKSGFETEVVEIVEDENELPERETYWIKQYKPERLYNREFTGKQNAHREKFERKENVNRTLRSEEEQKNRRTEEQINNTTLPPLPPNEIVQFGNVYNDITGNDPQFTPEEVDAIQEIIKAGGTTADYRKALEGMQAKHYTIATMASALKWTLGDIEKRNNGYKPTKQLSAGLDEILAGAPIFAEDK